MPAVNEKRQKCKDLCISHLPQVLIVSRDEDTIDKAYVILNQVFYNVENPLKARDVAFKITHMLDTPYPKESFREILFLQGAVYAITTKEDKKLFNTETITLIKEYEEFKSSKSKREESLLIKSEW